MRPKYLAVALIALAALGVSMFVAVGAEAAAATGGTAHIVALQVQVTKVVGGGNVGTFQIDPDQVVPVKPGGSYHLVLVGITFVNKKATQVPVNATFSVHAGRNRLTLSNPGANSVDVTVGKSGGLIKYVTAQGYDLRRHLASGFITLAVP
jgi:hypothetical protein